MTYETVLEFWYGNDPSDPFKNAPSWFKKDAAFDRQVKDQFEALLKEAVAGKLEDWRNESKSSLAYIILLDQFSRNIYRDDPRAWGQDAQAAKACKEAVEKGLDRTLLEYEKWFFYMPLMHTESKSDQELSVQVFKKLWDESRDEWKERFAGTYQYAVKHKEIIDRFGRYPHRNKTLGRESTPEEIDFLKKPGSSF